MSVKDIISKVVDQWFLNEPLFFDVYCTHHLEENRDMNCAFRTGKRRIEYNPNLLNDSSEEEIAQGLKWEVTRILLKHPYQRVPQNPNPAALTTASDITINEHCFYDQNRKNAGYYNLDRGMSYEEYYRKLYYICPPDADGLSLAKDKECGSGKTSAYGIAAETSELWDEDEELCVSVNAQIQKAQKTNLWGSVSGKFQETVTASLRIPMDYRRILSQFRACIISHSRQLTRMKPNRRYGFEYMGSKFEPKTRLLVAVDVSGSIGTDDLQNFFSIINRFFSYGVESIHVIAFDAEIKQEFELKKARRNIKICGRGGTDFQCAIDYYEGHPEYLGLIVFTDGYANVPKIIKCKQILWILTGKNEYEFALRWISRFRSNRATWIPCSK